MKSILLLFVVSLDAHAGVMLRTSGMYTAATVAAFETSRTLIDVNPAFVRDGGWSLGGTYQIDRARSGPDATSTTSLGPSVGLISRKEFGFFGVATYFARASRDDGRAGSGYQADLGYRFQFHHLSYALQFSYKRFSFARTEALPALAISRVDPYLGVWYEF